MYYDGIDFGGEHGHVTSDRPLDPIVQTTENTNSKERFEELKSMALENMNRRGGFLEVKHDKNGKRVIVFENSVLDGEGKGKKVVSKIEGKLKTRDLGVEIKTACSPLYKSELCSHTVDKVLFYMFEGETIVSRDDFNKIVKDDKQEWLVSELPRKEFFYVPKNKAEAFDLKKIKGNKKFYYIYGVRAKRRDQFYPTKEDGFDSGLLLPEVILPAIVFGKYGGVRDKEGKLWVNNKTSGEIIQEEISSKWLSKVAGYRIDQNLGNSIKPRAYLEEHCPHLLESWLIRKTDFREKEETGVVSGAGLATLDGVRYSVGKKYVGFRYSYDVNNGELKLTNLETNEVTKKTYSSDKRKARMTGKNSAYAGRQKDGVLERTMVSLSDSITVAEKVKIKIADELPKLKRLMTDLSELGAPDQIFEQYTQQEQLQMSNLLTSLDIASQEKCKKLMVDSGDSFLNLFRDIAKFGMFDTRLLKLVDVGERLSGELLNNYAVAVIAINNLADSLASELGDLKSVLLIDRITNAFKIKAAELIVAQLEGHDVLNQFQLMNEALEAFTSIYTKSPDYEMTKSWNKNYLKRKSKEVISVTAVYNGVNQKDNQKIKITFRPRAQLKEKIQIAQARMGIVFRNSSGQEFKFRIDLDLEKWGGASLDIGDTEGVIGKAFKAIGSGHHITAQFEKAFTNDEVFASLIKNWSKKLGYDFSKKT